MASQKFEKGSKEFQWFGDFWQVVQTIWKVEDDAEYWDGVNRVTEALYQKYKNCEKLERFCKKMTVAYVEFLDEEARSDRQR